MFPLSFIANTIRSRLCPVPLILILPLTEFSFFARLPDFILIRIHCLGRIRSFHPASQVVRSFRFRSIVQRGHFFPPLGFESAMCSKGILHFTSPRAIRPSQDVADLLKKLASMSNSTPPDWGNSVAGYGFSRGYRPWAFSPRDDNRALAFLPLSRPGGG